MRAQDVQSRHGEGELGGGEGQADCGDLDFSEDRMSVK